MTPEHWASQTLPYVTLLQPQTGLPSGEHLTVAHQVGGSCNPQIVFKSSEDCFLQDTNPIAKTKVRMIDIFFITACSNTIRKINNQTKK